MRAPAFDRQAADGTLVRAIAGAAPGVHAAAESELYRRFAPRVRLYGLRHLRDPHAAQDLVQQVLLMTLERVREGRLREPEKLASFVLGTCRMVVLELRRGAARREALLDAYGGAPEAEEGEAAEPLGRAKLPACLAGLAERERAVLVMSFFADQDAGEVGKSLGLSAGNVRVLRHRALAKLRACLGLAGER